MEIRVRDVGGLVPLLPRPCTPISQVRWQTEDYDGNKILLQVRGSTLFRRRHTIAKFTCLPGDPSPIPLPTLSEPSPGPAHSFRKGPTSYRSHRYSQTSPRPRNHTLTCLSNQDLCQASKAEEGAGPNRVRWAGHRSRSLFCLPTAATPSILHKPHPQNTCLPLGAQEDGLGREEEQSGRSWDTPAEQEQEFYI
ncbi:hypothetical protein ANANG_G00279040 [Anguilla anguilla]|uniref:FAM124 domain-containing protein n=1 Tax=Anguilla anguilla TaxID=7936 RepID=A0A9D3LNR9_ANGAN|nr:hypothetical protein ANANG_G00279040 [Anguilla anguilla]